MKDFCLELNVKDFCKVWWNIILGCFVAVLLASFFYGIYDFGRKSVRLERNEELEKQLYEFKNPKLLESLNYTAVLHFASTEYPAHYEVRFTNGQKLLMRYDCFKSFDKKFFNANQD